MRLFIIAVLILIFPSFTVLSEQGKHFTLKSTKGLISLKGTVNDSMRDYFVEKLISDDSKTFIVYIDSPGGDVYRMNEMIEFMQYSGKKFRCIAKYAASAAFSIFQFCDERYMMPFSSIIMSHNASGGVQGDIDQMKTQLNLWDNLIRNIEIQVAARLKMTYEEYRSLIADDIYMNYFIAKKLNAVDSPTFVTCSKKLIEERVEIRTEECNFFGQCTEKIEKVSACPVLNKTFK